jgi:serine/threonine protein kinase
MALGFGGVRTSADRPSGGLRGRVIIRALGIMADSPRHAARYSPTDIIGRMAGEYRLGKKLGEGGFGAVFEAEHPLLKRRAAVKILHQAAGVDSEAVLRFISEAQAVNQIKSRHIVDIFSFGVLADGRHFYVMDLLKGEPLDRYLDRQVRCDVPTALQLLRPIAETLDAAHAAGIVHRDLKPQNIFLAWEPSGETVPKLLDFGMAKLLAESPVHTASGTPVGTPLYMSPEQARGDKVDGRADVYAFGVLCHELLTGSVPITGESAVVVLVAHLMQAPPRVSEVQPDLPSELDAPILQMLEKNPDARPATVGEALHALIRAAERAGYEIPPGVPRLPLPPQRDEPPSDDRTSLSATAAVGDDLAATTPENDPNRQGFARSNDAAPGARVVPLIGVLLVLGAGAAYLTLSAIRTPAPAPTNSSTDSSVQSAALPSVAPSAGPSPSSSAMDSAAVPMPAPSAAELRSVDLTLHGAPAAAHVWLDGKMIGEAAGKISLPFGEQPIKLTLVAPGYDPMVLPVTPNHPLETTVKLKRRASSTAHSQIPSDLESPF